MNEHSGDATAPSCLVVVHVATPKPAADTTAAAAIGVLARFGEDARARVSSPHDDLMIAAPISD
jgi:hypothetical protein